jgi:23S rRNA pseudouridine2605 synthase
MKNNSDKNSERIQKIIAQSGYCSRRKAEELIRQGRVFKNSQRVKLGDKADPKDIIKVNNTLVRLEKKVYLILNKPKGYVSTSEDVYAEKKVIDLIDIPERFFSVGRLDKDTEGLILMTNDGQWANRLMHPRYEKEKEYLVKINKEIKPAHISEINKGVKLEDGFIRPEVKLIKPDELNIVIKEGRKRIVRRMFEHFGYKVIGLKRLRVGKYRLGNLKSGQWEYIDPK